MSRGGRFQMPAIADVIHHYGGPRVYPRMSGWTPMRCFEHDDTSPSAQVNGSTNRWQCLVCNLYEDSLDLIQRKEGLSVAAAREYAAEHFGVENAPRKGVRSRTRTGLFDSGDMAAGGRQQGLFGQ